MIGIFDSGLGGLAALREICRLRPQTDVLYVADTAYVPYGGRDAEELTARAQAAVAYFATQRAEAVLFACGTLSAVALPRLAPCDIPLFGVLYPAADAAARATRTGRVLVLATEASVSSGAYARALRERGVGCVLQRACPLFVPLVEQGLTSPADPAVAGMADHYLSDLASAGADTVILGCTHYSYLTEAVCQQLHPAAVIDAAAEAARACLAALPHTGGSGMRRFAVTGSPERVARRAAPLLSLASSLPVASVTI